MIDNTQLKSLIKFLTFGDIVSNQTDFAQKLGYEKSTISGMVSGKKPITESFANKVSEVYGVNMDWLRTGEGEMLKDSPREGVIQISRADIKEGDYSGALVYDLDATCGGDPREIAFTQDLVIGSVNLPEIKRSSKIIKASGDSMFPVIKSGDRLAIIEIQDWSYIAFGQIYMVQTEEYRFVKYVRKHQTNPESMVILRSANENYDDIELPKEKIIRLFAVEDILSVRSVL